MNQIGSANGKIKQENLFEADPKRVMSGNKILENKTVFEFDKIKEANVFKNKEFECLSKF